MSSANISDPLLALVRERGIRMQASGAGREGRMAALIGLDDARLPELVTKASAHGIFGVANRNSPGQVVVSGERPAVEFACGLAKELGAKRAIELPVSVAAHSDCGVPPDLGPRRRGARVAPFAADCGSTLDPTSRGDSTDAPSDGQAISRARANRCAPTARCARGGRHARGWCG